MNMEKIKFSTAVKILTLLAFLLPGVAVLMTACSPQTIVPVAATGGGGTGAGSGSGGSTATPNAIAGSIAITGILQNGNSSFSFVNTTASNIPSGTVIYFTNFAWDATLNGNVGGFVDESNNSFAAATTVAEGAISYTVGAGGLAPYTEVVIGSSGSSLGGGTVSNLGYNAVSGISNNSSSYLVMNHNGYGTHLFAYEGTPVAAGIPGGAAPSTAGITFINAVIFGPNAWNASTLNGGAIPANDWWDSYLPWALTYTYSSSNTTAPTGSFPYFCALDLSPLFNALGGQNTATQNQNGVLASCVTTLNGIETGSSWSGNSGSKTTFEFGSAFVAMSACGAGDAGYNVSYSGETAY